MFWSSSHCPGTGYLCFGSPGKNDVVTALANSLLIAAAIAASYFKGIQDDIPISNTQLSPLQAAFLFAYALMYAGGGKLIDLLAQLSMSALAPHLSGTKVPVYDSGTTGFGRIHEMLANGTGN